MNIKRKKLKVIYDKLENSEKKLWAANSNYSSYEGLYRYLRTNQDTEAFERVIKGLISTVGEDRFNGFVSSLENEENEIKSAVDLISEDANKFKKDIIETIFNTNDSQYVKNIKKDFEDIVSACDNQLSRLKMINEI